MEPPVHSPGHFFALPTGVYPVTRSLILPLSLVLAELLVAGNADAHARLKTPTPRSVSAGLKVGPCGAIPSGTARAQLMVGATVPIDFEETVNHPGHFRLALSMVGDTDFEAHILMDNIAHSDVGALPRPYTSMLTVPNLPCTQCTLQLIQVMTDGTPVNGVFPMYFSCADVQIVAPGGVPDAGVADVGVPDVGVPDVGVPDVGVPDAGTVGPAADAGIVDAGAIDSGSVSTTPTGTGSVDAGATPTGTGTGSGTGAGSPDSGQSSTPAATDGSADAVSTAACACLGVRSGSLGLANLLGLGGLWFFRRRRSALC